MKLPFPPPTDGKMHRICMRCYKDGVMRLDTLRPIRYECPHCGHNAERSYYFGDLQAWVDEAGELWHRSACIFVERPDGRFLFFKRNEFPVGLTLPAGHVDTGELPLEAGRRELKEETKLDVDVNELGCLEVIGDACSAAADRHVCHVFHAVVSDNETARVNISDEGSGPLWLSLQEAKEIGMIAGTDALARHFLRHL